MPGDGPRFDGVVPSGGYTWWYIDALSDDGAHGLTIIVFIGSVFSPYYAWTGWRDPYDHCAVNIGLYGRRARRWTMTERRRPALNQTERRLAIGPSHIEWDGTGLTLHLDETGAPVPAPVKGSVRLIPQALTATGFDLDTGGRHRWHPIAPSARVEVALDKPSLRWSGTGYFDTNNGDEPLERAFRSWTWSRLEHGAETAILYDIDRRAGGPYNLAIRVRRDGAIEPFEGPPVMPLPTTLWRVARETRADPGHRPRVVETLEDTPFYARSVIETSLLGSPITGVHESLSLERFAHPVVRLMLPFRMPRIFW